MGDHDTPATCVSSHEHDGDVRDNFLHYFGCLKTSQQQGFFNSLPEHERERLAAEEARIQRQRAHFERCEETKHLVDRLKISISKKFPNAVGRQESCPFDAKPCKENAYGLNSYILFFKNSESFTDSRYIDKFPNQKISLKDLLYNRDIETNPLMQSCKTNEIRYFHLPGNNMEWIEVC